MIERSRKKLEKTVKDTKDEVAALNEKIAQNQNDMNVRDEKILSLTKQLEAKTQEMENYLKVWVKTRKKGNAKVLCFISFFKCITKTNLLTSCKNY